MRIMKGPIKQLAIDLLPLIGLLVIYFLVGMAILKLSLPRITQLRGFQQGLVMILLSGGSFVLLVLLPYIYLRNKLDELFSADKKKGAQRK